MGPATKVYFNCWLVKLITYFEIIHEEHPGISTVLGPLKGLIRHWIINSPKGVGMGPIVDTLSCVLLIKYNTFITKQSFTHNTNTMFGF